MQVKIDTAYKPFQYCKFNGDEVESIVSAAIESAAKCLRIVPPDNLLVTVFDCATKPGTMHPSTGGSFCWPTTWSGGVLPPRITIYVHGGATVRDLERTAYHETFHLWEFETGQHPVYDEIAASRFADGFYKPA